MSRLLWDMWAGLVGAALIGALTAGSLAWLRWRSERRRWDARMESRLRESDLRWERRALDLAEEANRSRDAPPTVLVAAIDPDRQEAELLRRRIAELEALLMEVRRGSSADDLTQIRGVGPVLSERLRAHGMRSFQDIASWDQETLERVAAAVGSLPARVRREDWVGQARRLSSCREPDPGSS